MNCGRQMEQTLLLSKIFTQGGKTVVSVVDQHTILAQPNSKYLVITCYLSPMMVQQAENYGSQMELQQVHICWKTSIQALLQQIILQRISSWWVMLFTLVRMMERMDMSCGEPMVQKQVQYLSMIFAQVLIVPHRGISFKLVMIYTSQQ